MPLYWQSHFLSLVFSFSLQKASAKCIFPTNHNVTLLVYAVSMVTGTHATTPRFLEQPSLAGNRCMYSSGTMEVSPTETGIRYYYFNTQGKEGSRGNAINPVSLQAHYRVLGDSVQMKINTGFVFLDF